MTPKLCEWGWQIGETGAALFFIFGKDVKVKNIHAALKLSQTTIFKQHAATNQYFSRQTCRRCTR